MRAVLCAALLAAVAAAQMPVPHVGYVYPAGARAGSTVQIVAGGQFLDGVFEVLVSGSGVEASIVEYRKPLTQGQANKLRDELRELIDKRGDQKRIAEIREKLAAFVRRPANPALAELVLVEVRVAADAAYGNRELRLGTRAGLTNPLVFAVGELPEVSESPATVIAETRAAAAPIKRDTKPVVPVSLPAIVNGQITPGSVDRYSFGATKGQKLVVATSARSLMPYISDAVPGWFQPVVALFGPDGKEVAYADDYRFNPDPVLLYEVAQDGDYRLEVRDAIYRGREDFVYRIRVGELPFVTSVYPLGGRVGARTNVELSGWNLLSKTTVFSAERPGLHSVAGLPFSVDALPDRAEREPIKMPIIVNGRIEKPGDTDVFRIEGRAGDEIVAEVTARRLGSPVDSKLWLSDATGRQLAANDDFEDPAAPFVTHHADSRLMFKLPKKGVYYVHIADAQRQGGPEFAYRLRVSHAQPDFELRVTPSSVNARAGAAVVVTAHAIRKDGFAGEIAVELKDAPVGFVLSGGRIPAGQDRIRMTLTAPPRSGDTTHRLVLEGRVTVAGKQVRRVAVPAEEMMQAFAYRHLVPAQDWLVRVIGPSRRAPSWNYSGTLKLPAGGTAPLPMPRWAGDLVFRLSEPPEGISVDDGALRVDAAKMKPGARGNLIVEVFRPGKGRRQLVGLLPAIPYEVVKSAVITSP